MDAITRIPHPVNEPVKQYEPGSVDRATLERELTAVWDTKHELPSVINGERVHGDGEELQVVSPYEHSHVLGTIHSTGPKHAEQAIAAAQAAAPAWRALSFDDRAAIILKAADLLAGPWRAKLNAATMAGQAKTAIQAEIDAACELIDFWRFNAHFGKEITREQPMANAPGIWNQTDHRPLEGFVYAITPFNFTAIAGNLPTAPALMGNTVVWKPSTTQALAAQFTMELLMEAGMPAGVINMLHGHGRAISEVALTHRDLAGIHFTGSTPTFQMLWKTVGENIANYRSYPRLVGETGGKDFVLAHPSADVEALKIALVRGAFEYSGQKCSAASRAYVPKSIWAKLREPLAELTDSLKVGAASDFSNFTSAVIDDRSFAKLKDAIDRCHNASDVEVLAGGTYDDSVGYFIRPTVVVCENPRDEAMTTEYFGPLLAIHVFEDDQFEQILDHVDGDSDYALTGSIFSQDRYVISHVSQRLRFAAGNFYINDKPTGAVVGQQPFGGGRSSGTNDKAGAAQNLLRWTSQRSIKETFVPPYDHTYPHMG